MKAKKKGFTLSWKKDKTVTGYEVQYSLKKNFKGAKTEKINKSKITSKSVAKLKANKKYYVRIRSCVTVKVNGRTTKICSAWSVPKNVTPKK